MAAAPRTLPATTLTDPGALDAAAEAAVDLLADRAAAALALGHADLAASLLARARATRRRRRACRARPPPAWLSAPRPPASRQGLPCWTPGTRGRPACWRTPLMRWTRLPPVLTLRAGAPRRSACLPLPTWTAAPPPTPPPL